MKKKIMLIINIVMILFCIQMIRGSVVQATHTGGEIFGEAQNFISDGKANADTKINPSNLKNSSDMLYNILLSVGVVVAVGVSGVLGIKFMTGGIEEQAKVKEALLPFLAGCVILFGAFTIWKIVVLLTANL